MPAPKGLDRGQGSAGAVGHCHPGRGRTDHGGAGTAHVVVVVDHEGPGVGQCLGGHPAPNQVGPASTRERGSPPLATLLADCQQAAERPCQATVDGLAAGPLRGVVDRGHPEHRALYYVGHRLGPGQLPPVPVDLAERVDSAHDGRPVAPGGGLVGVVEAQGVLGASKLRRDRAAVDDGRGVGLPGSPGEHGHIAQQQRGANADLGPGQLLLRGRRHQEAPVQLQAVGAQITWAGAQNLGHLP